MYRRHRLSAWQKKSYDVPAKVKRQRLSYDKVSADRLFKTDIGDARFLCRSNVGDDGICIDDIDQVHGKRNILIYQQM